MTTFQNAPLGATYLGEDRTQFLVWAPKAAQVEVEFGSEPKFLALAAVRLGYHHGLLAGVGPGTRYRLRLDGKPGLPDPASRSQPEGVHGPSEVINPSFPWTDQHWRGLPLGAYVMYELHVGTFTPTGTFDAAIEKLDALKKLGVTVIELMPIAQFPGKRNWGYDGAYPYAAQDSYGGPDGLRRLVDACHARGLGVALDVVYNHFGPEGAYIDRFGYYFTNRYHTPWGDAINYDDTHCDEVRRYFIGNALSWVRDFHIDSLRLDAIHAIFDQSANPFLRELTEKVHACGERLNRRITVIAESDLNDPRVVESPEQGGLGFDAAWADDQHHAQHVLLTAEKGGYYPDFGGVVPLAKAIREGFVYTGQDSVYRSRRHGAPAAHLPPERFVVCTQNHDQVGNRAFGERNSLLLDREALKLTAATMILSPHIPLLFMGEEYGETAPFLYFVSHGDSALVEAVRRGRREEFAAFAWHDETPDPQAEETFCRSRLNWALLTEPWHAALCDYYRTLLELRRRVPALATQNRKQMEVTAFEDSTVIVMRRWEGDSNVAAVYHFGDGTQWRGRLPLGYWRVILDSADARWHGPGSRVEETVRSDGAVSLSLGAKHAIVLAREEGNGCES